MTFIGFLLVVFLGGGALLLLFHREKCELTEKDIDEFIHELEEEKKNLKPYSTEP